MMNTLAPPRFQAASGPIILYSENRDHRWNRCGARTWDSAARDEGDDGGYGPLRLLLFGLPETGEAGHGVAQGALRGRGLDDALRGVLVVTLHPEGGDTTGVILGGSGHGEGPGGRQRGAEQTLFTVKPPRSLKAGHVHPTVADALMAI